MDQEIKKEFESLTEIIKESFEDLELRMNGRFEDLESRMDVRFDHIEARLDHLEADVVDIKKSLRDLEKRVMEDTSALASDFLSLRAREDKVEKDLKQLQLARG